MSTKACAEALVEAKPFNFPCCFCICAMEIEASRVLINNTPSSELAKGGLQKSRRWPGGGLASLRRSQRYLLEWSCQPQLQLALLLVGVQHSCSESESNNWLANHIDPCWIVHADHEHGVSAHQHQTVGKLKLRDRLRKPRKVLEPT